MASTSETGHNKNVQNFSKAYTILEEMGALYQPTNTDILLNTLNPLRTQLQNTLDEISSKTPLYSNKVAERETEIDKLRPLSTSISNHFSGLKVSQADKDNALNITKKIRGDKTAKPTNTENKEEDNSISTSQQSYDNLVANFRKLIDFVKSHPEYQPNEEELKITTLEAFYDKLKSLNDEVTQAEAPIITAKKNRNDLLYFNPNNVIELITNIKSYLKSLKEKGKPYYDAIVKLKFKDIQR